MWLATNQEDDLQLVHLVNLFLEFLFFRSNFIVILLQNWIPYLLYGYHTANNVSTSHNELFITELLLVPIFQCL